MTFIDTHTHLFLEQFDTDREETINRAIAVGVEKMLLPNIDNTTLRNMFDLCDKFPKNCFPMVGLHPCSVNKDFKGHLNTIKTALQNNKKRCVAVGEIGIDLYWDKTFVEEQKIVFQEQIIWAKEFSLPIVIHVREAFDEVFDVVDKLNDNNLCGVFHCFTGNAEQAKHILSYGNFYFGIGGVVSYKKSTLPEVIADIPLNRILLETDSPYLAPSPHRGKRNESSFLVHIAERLVNIYDIHFDDLAKITTDNAKKLFFTNKR